MKLDLGGHRSAPFGDARGEHRAVVNEKWRVTRGIDQRVGAVATDQQHTARIGAEAGRDRAVGLHAITFDVGRPFSFPIPFVSSEVERSEEHTSELQSLMSNSYAVFCLKKKTKKIKYTL